MRRNVRFLALERIGFYSYSIYLWHAPITMFSRIFSLGFYINLVACCGVGILMSKLIERPVLALRERLFPAESGTSIDPETNEAKIPAANLPIAETELEPRLA
jgi:peptidoglycan/LPS O-acetylase OafA/YrhL